MVKDDGPTLFPKLRTYMQARWMAYYIRHGGATSQRELAIEIGINDTNLGRYMRGTQKPGPDTQDKIAKVLGAGIYAACDAPMRIPKNPLVVDIVMDFADLTKDQQQGYRDSIREDAENRRKNDGLAGKVVTT